MGVHDLNPGLLVCDACGSERPGVWLGPTTRGTDLCDVLKFAAEFVVSGESVDIISKIEDLQQSQQGGEAGTGVAFFELGERQPGHANACGDHVIVLFALG